MALVGWSETKASSAASIVWDVETLSDTPFNGGERPQAHQLVNTIPAMLHLCRKAVFAHILGRQRALLPSGSPLHDGRFIPSQWALPLQAAELAAHVAAAAAASKRKGEPPPTYIVKPDGGSMGDGIILTADPCRGSWDAARERVVQEYVATPLLLDGLKFDLRLYVLVTSVRPLRAYLYHEGLARFAVQGYVAPSKENLRDVHMHLTNYSLNKKADGFVHSEQPDGGDDGSKRTVSSVFAALAANGTVGSVDDLWSDIASLVARTLTVLEPHLASASASPGLPACFKILGFDVLLDAKARPWLLEVNDHPSLRIDLSYDEPGQYSMNGLHSIPSPVDEAIKAGQPPLVVRTGGRSSTTGASRGGALQRHDAELVFLAVCGRGGSMDVLAFAEACGKVACRLWPERAEAASVAELLTALLDVHYAASSAAESSHDEEDEDEEGDEEEAVDDHGAGPVPMVEAAPPPAARAADHP